MKLFGLYNLGSLLTHSLLIRSLFSRRSKSSLFFPFAILACLAISLPNNGISAQSNSAQSNSVQSSSTHDKKSEPVLASQPLDGCSARLSRLDAIRGDITAIAELTKDCPTSPEAFYALGLAQRSTGKLADARRAFRTASELSPLAPYRIALGAAALDLGEVDEASQAFARVLESDARSVPALIGRSLIAARAQAWDQAIGFLDRAAAIDSTNISVLFNRAVIAERLNRYKDAALDYQRVVELAPHMHAAWCRLGYIRFALREDHGAVTPLTKCSEGQTAPASNVSSGKDSRSLIPDEVRSSIILSRIISDGGDPERAELSMRRIAERFPNSAEAKLALAELYLDVQRFEAARGQARLATVLAPRSSLAWEFVGRAALGLGDTAEAESALGRAKELRGTAAPSAGLLNDLGVVRLRQGQSESARALFNEALTLDTGLDTARRNIKKAE